MGNKHIDEVLKLIDKVLEEEKEKPEWTQPIEEPVRAVTVISSSSTR